MAIFIYYAKMSTEEINVVCIADENLTTLEKTSNEGGGTVSIVNQVCKA